MDALNSFMLYMSQLRIMLAPVLTQGTAALDPLIKSYPWPFLVAGFILGICAATAFRALRGIIFRLILVPIVVVLAYIMYKSGAHIFDTVAPLLRAKFANM